MFKSFSIAYDHNVDEKYVKTIKSIFDELKIKYYEVISADESNDYPLLAKQAYELFLNKKCDGMVLLCGTGIGMNMVANKFSGIRAVLSNSEADAYFARIHENTNCIVFPSHYAKDGYEVKLCRRKMERMLRVFLQTEFTGEERHKRRIKEICEIENR